MKLDDLMLSVDDEQEMTVCILASNRTDVLHKISGDCGSIRNCRGSQLYSQMGV